MKIKYSIISSLLFLLFYSCNNNSNKVSISSDFDQGSIGSLINVKRNVFRGQTRHWIKNDKNGNQYYWFYFRMDGLPNDSITIQLDNLTGVYRGHLHEVFTEYTYPVLSYDQKHWVQITDVSYGKNTKSFTFRFTPEKDKVWLAYAHPYPLCRANALIDSIADNQDVDIEIIGKSVEGRDIRMVNITNSEKTGITKKVIVITALQHPGEDCGGYVMEGIIKELLSESKEIDKIKDHYLFKLIPVMNPDGLIHGICRYNMSMEDLNSEWDDDISDTLNLPVEPEVVSVKKWAGNWIAGNHKIDLFLDIHSNSQKYTKNNLWSMDINLERLVNSIHKKWKLIYINRDFTGSAAWYFQEFYGIPSGTLEITQSYIDENPGVYLTPDDYMDYGKGIVNGVCDFYLIKNNVE